MDEITTIFFSSLYASCEALVETRVFPGGAVDFWPNDFYAPDRQKYWNEHLKQWRNRNQFFGVGTRDGDGGKKENLVEIPSLWCDIDFKDTPPEEIHQRAKRFPFKPSAIVKTGGGYHSYWFLDEPALPADIPTVEAVNRRIAGALGGDLNSCDAARILRVPGSLNQKHGVPYSGSMIRVVRLESFRYSLDDFDILPAVEVVTSAPAEPPKNQLKRIFKCRFLRHAYTGRASLPEPLWYAMLSNVARISPGGVSWVHLFSKDHPKYNKSQTDLKILHALDASGPITCGKIQSNGFDGCGDCRGTTPLRQVLRKKHDHTRRDSSGTG